MFPFIAKKKKGCLKNRTLPWSWCWTNRALAFLWLSVRTVVLPTTIQLILPIFTSFCTAAAEQLVGGYSLNRETKTTMHPCGQNKELAQHKWRMAPTVLLGWSVCWRPLSAASGPITPRVTRPVKHRNSSGIILHINVLPLCIVFIIAQVYLIKWPIKLTSADQYFDTAPLVVSVRGLLTEPTERKLAAPQLVLSSSNPLIWSISSRSSWKSSCLRHPRHHILWGSWSAT